jgi:hypothetical protein
VTATAYAACGLILAGCAVYAWSGRRRRPVRPSRRLSLRERARWRHITRAYARGTELDELRACIARLEQDGSEDAR